MFGNGGNADNISQKIGQSKATVVEFGWLPNMRKMRKLRGSVMKKDNYFGVHR